MNRSFSFSEKPVLFILKVLPTILPGIEKVISVFWDHEKQNTESFVLKNEDGEFSTEPMIVADINSIIKRYRLETAPYTWLRLEDLPFDVKQKEKVQLNIFNELNNNILLVRIKNPFDGNNDLYFFYFSKDMRNFGTVSSDKILSTDNKTIIAHLVRNTIIAQFTTLSEDRELFATHLENTRQILHETNQLRKSVNVLSDRLKDGILQLCYTYLNEISAVHPWKFQLSQSAVNKLKEYQGSLNNLKPILEKAAGFAATMVQDKDRETVLISDYHIYFSAEAEQKTPEPDSEHVGEVPARYNKTLALLDKLENAARQLKSQNKVLTSQNIGNELSKPITPPAISDALKKHSSKIQYLLKEYPNRWIVIRNEFRPVQNILNARHRSEKLSA
jgi:hypothetical protein